MSLVTLAVKDLARARSFYAKGLGWKESSASNPHIAFFQLGTMALALFGDHALAEDIGIKSMGAPPGRVTLAQNCASKAEVDGVLQDAVRAGATLLKPAQDVFWGGYSGYFADPEGQVWEVAWNPFFALSADGTVTLPG